jgi:nitrogen fixation protein FixH
VVGEVRACKSFYSWLRGKVMKKVMKSFKPVVISLGLVLVMLALVTACGGGGPQERSFTIQIENGEPAGGTQTFRVKQGDTVSFNVSSDIEGEVHLHGYDLRKKMSPGETTSMVFTANATGRFLIEIEEMGAEGEHAENEHAGEGVEIGYLEVQPR